ncbi:MAG: hypothetical protein HY962_10245 [Ignavibacteriae bacterium]|nr:hypothetical protein [Ignavibacteriota bacterium]
MTLVLLLTAAAIAAGQKGWKTFEGAWFTIEYPREFVARVSLKSATGIGAESVFFASPDGAVEFYVFSPQWSGEPVDILLNERREKVVTRSEQQIDQYTVTLVTIADRGGRYTRSYRDIITENTRVVFGIKYRRAEDLVRFRPAFERFKKSLRQFAD